MTRIVKVFSMLSLMLIVSGCSRELLTINPVTGEKIEKGEETKVAPTNKILLEEMEGSFVNGEVTLMIILINEDNLQINSVIINGKEYSDFEIDNLNKELLIKIYNESYIGNKIYELEKVLYSIESDIYEEEIIENNLVDVQITNNINGYEFLQIPQYPMDYVRITAEWHSDWHYNNGYGLHKGIDLGGTFGGDGRDDIFSIADGQVVKIGVDSDGGKYIILKHENLIKGKTVISRYWHFHNYEPFNVGDKVKKGQYLGLEGTTGLSTGNHLHFEMWIAPENYYYYYYDKSKYAVNPVDYLFLESNQTLSSMSLEKNKILEYFMKLY